MSWAMEAWRRVGNGVGEATARAVAKRIFEQVERLRFGVAAIRRERTAARVGVGPASGDGQKFFVQPGGARAVEREAAEQDDARDGVVGLREAGAREVVVDKALREKTTEKALHDAVLEVELHDVFVNAFGRVEDHRTNGRLPAPFEAAFAVFGGLRSVSSVVGPGGIGSASGVQIGKAKTLRRLLRCRRRFEGLGTEHFQRAGDGVAKLVIVETDPLPGIVESIPERVDLPLERFPTIPVDFEFLVGDRCFSLSSCAASISPASFSASARRMP